MQDVIEQVKWKRLAPARVNLLGEHIDYTGGMVLLMAIPFHTRATIQRAEGFDSRMYTHLFNEEYVVPAGHAPKPTGEWSDYPTGALEEFRKLKIEVTHSCCAYRATCPLEPD